MNIDIPEQITSELDKLFDDFPNGMEMTRSELVKELIREHKELKHMKAEQERTSPC